jgi:hypothetical protein
VFYISDGKNDIIDNLDDLKALIRNFDEFNQDKEFVRKPARKMQLEDFLNKLKMIKGLLQLKIMMLNIQHEYADLVSEDFETSDDSYSPACKVHNYTYLSKYVRFSNIYCICEIIINDLYFFKLLFRRAGWLLL